MAKRPIPSPELLRQLLEYNPSTGRLIWRHRSEAMFAAGLNGPRHQANAWNAKLAGKYADESINDAGYRIVRLWKKQFPAHRLIVTMNEGAAPANEVDHINGLRSDNRASNLRCVTKTENMRNQKRRSDNVSGVCGVYWSKAASKWQAYIRIDGKCRYLGVFETLEAAAEKRKQAEVEAGFHENHGRSS